MDELSRRGALGNQREAVWEELKKNKKIENKFIFIPDNTFASTCGCGTSFTPKQNK